MNALEQWRSRPLQVSVLDRCDECGELKEDVQKRVNYWPNITAVCCGKCFTEMTGQYSGSSALSGVSDGWNGAHRNAVATEPDKSVFP